MASIKTSKAGLFLAATFSVIALLVVLAPALAGIWFQASRLTNNGFDEANPQVSGGKAVWFGSDGFDNEIFLYNGSSVMQLTDNDVADSNPQISGDNVVWEGEDGFDNDIFLYNGSAVTTLTTNDVSDSNPQISEGNVVWQGWDGISDTEIFLYNGSTATTLTDNGFDDLYPRISGNKVVWRGSNVVNDQIFFYDGSAVTTLTTGQGIGVPQISGGKAVWHGSDGADTEIFLYNGSNVTTLTDNGFDDKYPYISGDNVVWQGWDGGDNEIFLYNGSTVTQLTDNGFADLYPRISGQNIVWVGWDAGDSEIFFYNGFTVATLTDNDFNDTGPEVSGSNVVWAGAEGGADWEVFMARVDQVVPADPLVAGSSPAAGLWTNNNVVLVNFAGATDNLSGVDGYSIEWSGSPSTVPDAVKDLEESAAAALSPPQPDGDRYFHLRTLDNAGNWTSTIHYGPFKIDTVKPRAVVRTPKRVFGSTKFKRFRVSWRGLDSLSGAKTFNVAYKIGKRGKWRRWKTGISALRAKFKARVGKVYYFRARAKDTAGNVGAWSRRRRTVVKAL